jgi:hypothetical protein
VDPRGPPAPSASTASPSSSSRRRCSTDRASTPPT